MFAARFQVSLGKYLAAKVPKIHVLETFCDA